MRKAEQTGLKPRVRKTDAAAIVRASKVAAYDPKNPLATFVDDYGDERIIHRPKGRSLRVYRGLTTAPLKLNKAIAPLVGARIRERRLALGLTLQQVAARAGMATGGNPKAVMHAIESAGKPGRRSEGVRLGTLFALAHALECSPADLLPNMEEAIDTAGVAQSEFVGLAA